MPEGLSQKQFEEKHTELEQALNSKIEYGFNKNLIMKLQEMNLGTKYDYEFEECEEPTKIFIGYSHEGKFYFDIDEAVQTLIAGEPKSGKSSLLRTICLSLILSKHNLELRLIDFQNVELGIFQDCKKVKSYGKAPPEFEKLLNEMRIESERRLDVYASVRNQRFIQNLGVWNKYYPDKAMPYIIVVIDEFARLAHEEYKPLLEEFMNRVAMDRKCGVLYLVSCQRPDVKVISGSIKGCMPTRIAYRVVTDTDSKVILDIEGAEKIKQRGRCIMKYNGEIKEVQTLYIEPEDVRKILKKNKAFKTAEEKELEKQLAKKKQIEEFRKKHGNGYPSGGVNIDN
jgi:S-DNA-T family DNA segregation ATPase FtsK/SpoIIIE